MDICISGWNLPRKFVLKSACENFKQTLVCQLVHHYVTVKHKIHSTLVIINDSNWRRNKKFTFTKWDYVSTENKNNEKNHRAKQHFSELKLT